MHGQALTLGRPFGSYVMENVLFKISFPAEFHGQTAVEAAIILHRQLRAQGRTAEDIEHIAIRTQEACIRIIDKQGPLHNPADRDHCVQYMVAIALLHGRLVAEDYEDDMAADTRIDALRAKMTCHEDPQLSDDYLDPDKRSIANGLTVRFNDGSALPEVLVEYPLGHARRRAEGIPLLMDKFRRHLTHRFPTAQQQRILAASLDPVALAAMPVTDYVDLYLPG